MTATDRSRRRSAADHTGREARIEAVTRDLVADVEWEQKRQARVSPDCRDGKHRACIGDAWDTEADTPADCECDCHEEGTE